MYKFSNFWWGFNVGYLLIQATCIPTTLIIKFIPPGGTSTILHIFTPFSLAIFLYKPVYMPCLILPSITYTLFYEILQVVSVLSLAIKARSTSGIRMRGMGQSKRKGGGGGLTIVGGLLIWFCLKSSGSYYIFYYRLDHVYVQYPLSRVKQRLTPKVEGQAASSYICLLQYLLLIRYLFYTPKEEIFYRFSYLFIVILI